MWFCKNLNVCFYVNNIIIFFVCLFTLMFFKQIINFHSQDIKDNVQQLQQSLEKTECIIGDLPTDNLENILKALNVSYLIIFIYLKYYH